MKTDFRKITGKGHNSQNNDKLLMVSFCSAFFVVWIIRKHINQCINGMGECRYDSFYGGLGKYTAQWLAGQSVSVQNGQRYDFL